MYDVDGLDLIGFDWMQLAKGAAGVLQGAGGLLSGGGGGAANAAAVQAALIEKQRLEDERRRAEEDAQRTRLYLGIGGVAAAGTIFALLLRGK